MSTTEEKNICVVLKKKEKQKPEEFFVVENILFRWKSEKQIQNKDKRKKDGPFILKTIDNCTWKADSKKRGPFILKTIVVYTFP